MSTELLSLPDTCLVSLKIIFPSSEMEGNKVGEKLIKPERKVLNFLDAREN